MLYKRICCNEPQTWALITGDRIYWYCVLCKRAEETRISNAKQLIQKEPYIEDFSYSYTYWTDLYGLDID